LTSKTTIRSSLIFVGSDSVSKMTLLCQAEIFNTIIALLCFIFSDVTQFVRPLIAVVEEGSRLEGLSCHACDAIARDSNFETLDLSHTRFAGAEIASVLQERKR